MIYLRRILACLCMQELTTVCVMIVYSYLRLSDSYIFCKKIIKNFLNYVTIEVLKDVERFSIYNAEGCRKPRNNTLAKAPHFRGRGGAEKTRVR
jgi:hypothetical protein